MQQQDSITIQPYYRENFFSNDSLYHPELDGGRVGVAGDPVPYTIGNDDLVTGILVVCFIVMAYAFSRTSDFIIRQARNFFYVQKGEHTIAETGNELRVQLVFIAISCFVYALLYYSYTVHFVEDTFILSSEYALIGIFMAVFTGYFLLKFPLYTMVNSVFFDSARNKKFLTSILFITAMEGLLMFPAVLLLSYLHSAVQTVVYYIAGVVILAKTLAFYKTYIIFFRQNGLYVQFFLYFCALEIVPLLSLWGGLAVIVEHLKVIF